MQSQPLIGSADTRYIFLTDRPMHHLSLTMNLLNQLCTPHCNQLITILFVFVWILTITLIILVIVPNKETFLVILTISKKFCKPLAHRSCESPIFFGLLFQYAIVKFSKRPYLTDSRSCFSKQ